MNNDLEQIKQKIDIVELIGQYVNLKRAGANLRGICPFHEERTPSFMVSPDKQIFKCFGCSKGGDIFSFIQERENLTFPETVKLLADKAGVTLSRDNTPRLGADKKNRLFNLNHLISAVYQKLLLDHPSGKPALEYLIKRKLSIETIKKFQIGWAPQSTNFLLELIRKKGYSSRELQEIGSPEKLRGRITFPLKDNLGNVVGFSGRTLDPNRQPKYLNSPDTEIFHKSLVIYNLFTCKEAIKKNERVVLVEGQMDVIASVQAGVEETVATSGTALTQAQLKILYRYTDKLILAFDNDLAGINATKRAIELALPIGFIVYISQVTSGKDPGDMAIESPEKWRKLVDKPIHFIPWLFQTILPKDSNIISANQKRQLTKKIVPFIQLIEEPISRDEAISKLAISLQISRNTADELVSRKNSSVANNKKEENPDKIDYQDRLIVGLVYLFPQAIDRLNEVIKFANTEYEQIYNTLKKEYNKIRQNNDKIKNSDLKSTLDRNTKNQLDDIALDIQNRFDLSEKKTVAKLFQDISKYFQKDENERIKIKFAQEIKIAEEQKDREKVKKLLSELSKKIK